MSEAQEIRMGQESDPSIVAGYGLYQDTELQKFINERGMEMAKVSHRPHLPYEFKILDSPVVNAFAVPGGFIYFTRGIMAHFNNEAQFAGVLGHEIGHVTARHSASQYSKSMLAQVGFVAGMVVSPEFRQFAQSAQQGLGLLFLKFGRDAERQSDELGVAYSSEVGYDAKEMAGFFKTLQRMQEAAGAELPTFMSTHPHPGDRYNDAGEMATQTQQQNPGKKYEINRNGYLRMIDGIVYGEDPRQGYVQNNVFYHPELRFEFPTPNSWRVNNTPSQVQISPQDGKALIIFTLSQQKTLDAAAQSFIEQTKLQVAASDKGQVNGLNSIAVLGDQVNEESQQTIRILNYFIQYGQYIYQFHGLALKQDYPQYSNIFQNTMKGFAELTDRSKIEVSPERVSVQEVKKSGKVSDVLRSFNMPTDRHEELAILNGMELTQVIQAGTLIKLVSKKDVPPSQGKDITPSNNGKTDEPIISPTGDPNRALTPGKTTKPSTTKKNKKKKLIIKPKTKEGNGR